MVIEEFNIGTPWGFEFNAVIENVSNRVMVDPNAVFSDAHAVPLSEDHGVAYFGILKIFEIQAATEPWTFEMGPSVGANFINLAAAPLPFIRYAVEYTNVVQD